MPEIPTETAPELPADAMNTSPLRSPPPLYRRPGLVGVLAILVVALAIIGIRFSLFSRAHETTRHAMIQTEGAAVSILAFFTETQASRLKPGQLARIRLPDSREALRGHVESLADVSPDETTTYRRIPVKITIDTPPPPNTPLHPGSPVTVRVAIR